MEILIAERSKYPLSRDFAAAALLKKTGRRVEILEDAGGRPYVPGDELYFSISHSRGLIAIAMAKRNIAIDMEFMKSRNFPDMSRELFGMEISDADEFYRRWTCYEACVKYHSKSVFDLGFRLDEKLNYKTFNIKGGYLLSAVSAERLDNLAIGEMR